MRAMFRPDWPLSLFPLSLKRPRLEMRPADVFARGSCAPPYAGPVSRETGTILDGFAGREVAPPSFCHLSRSALNGVPGRRIRNVGGRDLPTARVLVTGDDLTRYPLFQTRPGPSRAWHPGPFRLDLQPSSF